AVNRDARAMGEKLREGDRSLLRPFVVGNLPGLQVIVDVLLERDLSLFGFLQNRRGGDRLADRSRLEERRLGRARERVPVRDSVGLRPEDPSRSEHGDRDPGDVVEPHPLLERPGLVALQEDRRPEPPLHHLDLRSRSLLRRRPGRQKKQQCRRQSAPTSPGIQNPKSKIQNRDHRPTGRVTTASKPVLSGPKFLTRYAINAARRLSGTSAPQPTIFVTLAVHCFSFNRCWRTMSVAWQL